MITAWLLKPIAPFVFEEPEPPPNTLDLIEDLRKFDLYSYISNVKARAFLSDPHEGMPLENPSSDVTPPPTSSTYSESAFLEALPSVGPRSGIFWTYCTHYLSEPVRFRLNHWYYKYERLVEPDLNLRNLMLLALLYGVSVSTWRLLKPMFRERSREFISYLIYRKRQNVVPSKVYKSAFSRLVVPDFKPISDNHSHPYSAAARNVASALCHNFAIAVGLTPYYVQMSSADQNRGYSGSRSYFWYKDVSLNPMPLQPSDQHMPIIVDTDHYIDMPYLLGWQTNPVLIATFQPHAVAMSQNKQSNFSFTFDSDNNVDYIVAGSARYQHPVWNYNKETITCFRKFFGIPYCCTSYLVERITTEVHHEIIMLAPIGSWNFFASLMLYVFGDNELERLTVNQGSHNRLLVRNSEQLMISTGVPNTFSVATISAELDSTISLKSSLSKSGLTNAGIATMLPGDPADPEIQTKNTIAAVLLNDFHTRNPNPNKPVLVAPNPRQYKRYQYGDRHDDEAKPSLYAFMSPIIDGSYGPDKTAENEKRAVLKRIEEPKNDANMTPFIAKCIDEFVNLLVPVPHTLYPLDFEQIPEHFTKPVQRLQYNNVNESGFGFAHRIKAFLKAEAYGKPAAPRIISTINDHDKMHYSRFQYAVSEWLKQFKCYAFGRTPHEISEQIANMSIPATYMTEADFSTFDGSIGLTLREFERALLFRLFAREHHEWLDYCLINQRNLLCRLPMGTKYNQNNGRASGSPETSNLNTVDNMFVNYLARRTITNKMETNQIFKQVIEQSVFGGDDSLAADLPPTCLNRACKMLGLIVKIKITHRNQGGMTFLSRVYTPSVWHGDPNNCADILRAMKKLHTSHVRANNISDKQYFVDKMYSFNLTDGATPYLGTLAQTVEHWRFADNLKPDLTNLGFLATWQLETKSPFPNEPCDYFLEYAQSTMSTFNEVLFFQHLESCNKLEDLLHFPLCMEFVSPELPTDSTLHVSGETVVVGPPALPLKSKARAKKSRDRARKYRNLTKQSKSPAGKTE